MPRQKQSNPKPLKQQQAEVKQLLRKTRGKSNAGSKNSQKPLHWKLLTKEHFEKKIKLRSKFAPKKKSAGGERVAKKSQQKNSKKDELVENQLDLNIKDVGLTVGHQSSPVFKDKYDFIKERARMARSGKQEPHTDVTEGDTVVASSSKLITSNPSKSMNLGAEISLKTGRGSNTIVNQEKQNYRDEQQAIEALLQIKSVDLQAINNNNPVIASNHYNNTKPQVAFHQKGEHIESQGKHGLTSRDTAMNQSPLIFHTSKYQDISPGNVARNMTVDVEVESPLDTRQSKKIGRHICEYCGHRCAKPSVLTKHLRSHTGERPYPCKPCGFAFKTKSNLYKHCKSHAHSVKVGIMFNDSPLKGSNGEEDSEETESEDETKHSQREEDVVRNHQHPVLVDTESSHTSHKLTVTPSSKAGVVSESCTIAFKGHVPHTPKKESTKLTEHSISKLLKGNEQVNNFPQTQDPGIAGYKANMESKEPSPQESSPPTGSASGNVDSDKILIPLSNFNIVKTKGQYHLQLPMGTLPPEALASIQSRAKDSAGDATSGNKEIKERIQKLISDNEEIIDNSDLESVKPRKLGFDFKEGEFLSEDDVAKLKSETERSDTKDRIEPTTASTVSTVISSVAQHSNAPESNKSIKHISLQHTRQLGSAFEIPHSHKKPLVPGPLNLSSSGLQTSEGVSVKKRKAASETRETVEEGMVFFSKKMKKTLYMPPDASSKKVSIESPQPAILSNLLTAPKVTQGQKSSMSNSMMFSSSLKKIASPFSAHGSSEMALASPASSVGLATSSCVPVIQHTPKSDSSSFSFSSDPNKRELSSNQQGLLRISTNAEQWGDTSDSQASLMRPSSLNLGVRTVNSSYISKSERRRLSNKLIPTPKSGTSPKSLSSPRDGNLIHGVGSSDVPSIQLASPRVRGSLPTPDLAWKKGAEKSPFQSLNIDVASPLAKMIKFPPVGSGGKPIIDPRVLLSPEALSIAESVMKKASPTNAKTPSTPVEQARELGRLVAHAFHNAGGNIDSVLSTSDGNLIVGPIATPTSTGAKSQIFILPSPSSTQAPSFPGMSPSTPSKPFTPTGSGQVPFALSGPPPKVKTPTGVPMKALTPTGPGKGFSLGFGQSKPLTPVASKIFPTSVGASNSVIPSPATPGKMASSFMQFPSKISSPHPGSHRSMTPTTVALQKSVPTVKPVPYSSSCNVALTFSGSTTKVKSLTTGNAKPNLTGLKSLPVTPGNQSLAVLTPGIANRGSGASSPTHPVALKLTVPSSQAGGLSEAPMNLSMSASSASDDTKQPSQSHALERKSSEDIKSYSQNFSNNMLTKGKRKLLGLVKNEQGQTLPTVPIFLYANMSARMCGVTQVTNCCSKRLQPMYAVQGGNSKVSMYSNWRSARHVEHPLGISWKIHLGLYNSHRNRKSKVCYSQCNFTPGGIYTESKNMKKTKVRKKERNSSANKESRQHHRRVEEGSGTDAVKDENEGKSQPTNTVGTSDVPNVELARIPLFPGGYESHEDYVYVRGRGRGKYVCMECGIRCKKPSMLKKHIRTHTDVRPYQCKGCSFSFKTKGNLTKHMKSKAHVKKCLELGLPPGDVDLDSATDDVCDMEDGEDNQFADVDSEDTDSICSDNSEEEEEMDSEDSARETPSSIVEAPYGVKTSNHITRVGSCTTSVAAVTDRELPPTLKALHDRMGLKRSLSEAQLTPLSAKNDSEKDPAREQRLDELMGALKNRTMPPLNKPSRSEVVCKLTQHLTNKQQRNSTDGKSLPSPMKRSMSVNNLPIASHSLLRPSPSLPTVRPALNDGSKQNRTLQGYQESEVSLDSATKSVAISSDLVTSAMTTTPTMSKKSILTRRFEQKEGKDSNLERLHIAPIAVNSHMQTKSGNLSKDSMKLDVSSRDARNSLDTRNSLLVPPPIIEPISDDEDEEKDKKPSSAEVKLEQSKIIPGSQRFVSSVPDTSNAIKTLLLTRAPVWPFPMEGIPCSPYSPRFIPPSPSLLNAAPSPNLLMPYSPISGRPPLVSPMSPSKLSQLPPTVLSRVHSPSPLARTSPHFRLEHTLRADNNQTLSVKKETPVNQNVQVPTSSTLLKSSEFEMPANVSTSTPLTSGEAIPEEEQSIPIPSTTGPHKCSVCGKGFMKPNQLRIHIREHSLEKYYTCFDCCLHFPTKSLLSKHERTEQHFAKVEAVEIATVGTDPEPRPFKCKECAIAFRIPGHLAKHLRSRGHLMTLERSGKLPPHKEQLLRAELGQDDRDDALSPESSERTDSASEAEDDLEFRRGT